MSSTDDKPALTVFDGVKDRQQARVVQALLDPMSIRVRVVKNADGSETRHKMRGGFPEAVTDPIASGEQSNEYVRGYVSNIKSDALALIAATWSAIIKRVSAVWKKRKLTKKFGGYVVAPMSAPTPDIWVNYKPASGPEELRMFRKNGVSKLPLVAGTTGSVDGLPLLYIQDHATPYMGSTAPNADWHVFLLDRDQVSHKTGTGSDLLEAVYTTDELVDLTEGYPEQIDAGVSYKHGKPLQVGYNRLHISAVGSMLQRSRLLELNPTPPYVTLSTYASNLVPGVLYLYPAGGTTSDTETGLWKNPVPDGDAAICEMYRKVGSPPDIYGAYSFVGLLRGDYVDSLDSYTTTTEFSGSNGHTANHYVGWFGKPVSIDIAMSVSAFHKRESSAGNRQNECPVLIADSRFGSESEPPAWTHQWRSLSEATGNTEIGDRLTMTCTGSSEKLDWGSTSTSVGMLGDIELCRIEYQNSGWEKTLTGTQFFAQVGQALDGVEVGLTPLSNPYNAAYNAVLVCNIEILPDGVTSWTRPESFYEHTNYAAWSIYAKTRDYLLFDPENDAYVYLVGEFSGGENNCIITLDLVVDYRGHTYAKRLREFASSAAGFLVDTESINAQLDFHPPPVPFTGFAPPFCCQGEFKFGAYAEVADTDEPVFLLSLPLAIKMRDDSPEPPAGSYLFDPMTFKGVFGRYAGIVAANGFWDGFSSERNIINFADGQFTDWVSAVYPSSLSDVSTYSEVYRT